MSLTTQCPEGLNTSLQASQSLMRILEPYDWATNAIERSRLESQPYNKLLSAAALALQSYCSRISRQQVERRNTTGNAMTQIRYVHEAEQTDENGAVSVLYEKPLSQPQFAYLRHTKSGIESPSHVRGRPLQRGRGSEHVRRHFDPVTGRNRVDPRTGVVPK
jgi:hypothetical protein